jgi:hypothetical protein
VAFNPHQDPPRKPRSSLRPHILEGIFNSDCGKEIVKHSSKEGQGEYALLKSSLSYLWDARQYFGDWSPAFGTNPAASEAVEAIGNTLEGVYDLLNARLVLINLKTKKKSTNPTYALTAADQELLDELDAVLAM